MVLLNMLIIPKQIQIYVALKCFRNTKSRLKTMTLYGCLDGCHPKATYKEKINNNQIIITLGTQALVCCSVFFFRKPLRYSLQPDIMLW